MLETFKSWFRCGQDIRPLAATLPPIFHAAGGLHRVPIASANPLLTPRINEAGTSWEMAPLNLPHADAVANGVKGDNTTDEGPALQDIVDGMAATGGVIHFDPTRCYAIGTKVQIKSLYPIWLVSAMFGKLNGGGGATTHADHCIIRPLDNLDYLFEWTVPAGAIWGEGGGGGIRGLSITDWIMPGTGRSKELEAAVRVDTPAWFCEDCNFEWINGRAIEFGTTIYSVLRYSKFYNCGAVGKPTLDLDGNGSDANVWLGPYIFAESCTYGSPTIRVNTSCALNATHLYFEDGVNQDQIFMDGHDGGRIEVYDSLFNNTGATSIRANAPDCRIHSCQLNNDTTVPPLLVEASAVRCVVSDLTIMGVLWGGPAVDWRGDYGMANGVYINSCGRFDATLAQHCNFSNIFSIGPRGANDTYAIDLGPNNLIGGEVWGTAPSASGSLCNGIRTSTGKVTGMTVRDMDGGDGITTTGAAHLVGNTVLPATLNGGLPYVLDSGTKMKGNSGGVATDSDTDASDSVVVNWEHGSATTKVLSTGVGMTYDLIINNTMVSAASIVIASARLGTADAGVPVITKIVPAASRFTVTIQNVGSADFNGTIIIDFVVNN